MANKEEDVSDALVAEPASSIQARTELLQNEDLYETLFLDSPDGVVLTVEGKIALVSGRAAEMSGYSTEEAIGMAPSDLLVPEERERAKARGRALLEKGPASPSAYTLLQKDGARVPVDVHSKLVQHHGKAAIISVARDISEQRQAEEVVRALEEERYRRLLEESPDGIVIVDGYGVIETVNARTEELFGYDRNELLGRPVELLIPERFRQRHHAHRQTYTTAPHARVMATALDHYGLRRDGSEFPTAVSLNVMPSGAGISVIATVRDMTAYVEAAKALHDSEARFSTAFHDNPVSVTIARMRDGKFIDVNDAFLSMTGHRRAEAIGRTADELGFLVDPGVLEKAAQAVREHGTVQDFPVQLRKRTGEVLDVMATITQIEIEGEPCFLATTINITERKRLEEELQKMRDDLESKVERQLDRGNAYKLTFREYTVLHLIADGKADKEIAAELGISIFTVHRHVSNILGKMNSPSRTEAGTRALREGLLE